MKIFFQILFFIISSSIFLQEAMAQYPDSSAITIQGQVISQDNALGVPFVHVIKNILTVG